MEGGEEEGEGMSLPWHASLVASPFTGLAAEVTPATPVGSECQGPKFSSCVDSVSPGCRPCPEQCPFVVSSESFVCAYFCVTAGACSAVNPRLALPNWETKQCEACPMAGCKLCSTPYRCSECLDNFNFANDGRSCIFKEDARFKTVITALLGPVIAAAVLVVICLRMGKHERKRSFRLRDRDQGKGKRKEEKLQFHAEVLRLARWHHHWCKVREWAREPLKGRGAEKEPLLSLFTNMHKTYLVDVGMPLYYNFMVFMMVFFLLCSALHRIFSWQRLDSTVFAKLDSITSYATNLTMCSELNSTQAERSVDRLGRENILEFTMFYSLGLICVTLFSCLQFRKTHRFVTQFKAMRWHAVSVQGFPEDATDEAEIKKQLEQSFSYALQRPPDDPVKLAYVSICYHVHQTPEFGKEVQRLTDRLITLEDVRTRAYSHEFADTAQEACRVWRDMETQYSRSSSKEDPGGQLGSDGPPRKDEPEQSAVESPSQAWGELESAASNPGEYAHKSVWIPKYQATNRSHVYHGLQQDYNEPPPEAWASREEWLEAATAQFRADTEALLGLNRCGRCTNLKNTGEVFAVFERAEDCFDMLESQVVKRESMKSFVMGTQYLKHGKPSVKDSDGKVNTLTYREGVSVEEAQESLVLRSLTEPLRIREDSAGEMSVTRFQTEHHTLRNPKIFTGGKLPPRSESIQDHLLTGVYPLEVFSMRCEPVSIGWENYGLRPKARIWRSFQFMLEVLGAFCLFLCLVTYPSMQYVRTYTLQVHSSPGGVGSKAFGILVGTANWLICVTIASRVGRAGYLRKDREEVLIFFCFIFMCVSNTMLNVFMTSVWVHTNEMHVMSEDWEMRVSADIMAMLFPGSFIPCLLWPLQGFLWPFLEGFIDLRFRRADDLTVRQAERRLEPLPIGLAWDYQGSLTTPVLGFLVMFYVSNGLELVLLYLALWSAFFYWQQHFNHLRMAKIAYTTSNRLDTAVLWSWGFVLGEMAAAAAYWGVRTRGWSRMAIPVAFAAGTGLLWLLLGQVVRPLQWGMHREVSREEVVNSIGQTRATTLYDWANCNPVLVLKSRILDLAEAGVPPQLPFTVGKTHAWEARRRLGLGPDDDPPEPTRTWYEPGSLYRRLGLLK